MLSLSYVLLIVWPGMENLDEIDRRLIGLLRKNARAPVAQLAKTVGVSRATIQNRMARLEKRGHITGYTALVSHAANEKLSTVRAIMNIAMEGSVGQLVKETLLKEPSVTAIHSTNGHWDYIVELQTRSLEEFDRVISRIRSTKGIKSSDTSILLSTRRLTSEQL